MAKKIPAPEGAHKRAVKLWDSIVKEYSDELSDSQFELLKRLVEVIGIIEQARTELEYEGTLTYYDKAEQPKERPQLKIIKEYITLEKSLIRELYLDEGDDSEPV